MDSPVLSRQRLAFLIGVPLAWAVLLLFHPTGSGELYDEVRGEVTRWQVVHVGTLFFIGLMGLAVYLLVRDLTGLAARVSRWAAAVFVLFYGAWEAVAGLAVGALVQYTNGLPAAERPVGSDAIESLNDNAIVGDFGLLAIIGSLGWITAVIAAALAVRRAGAPLAAAVLLGLSAIVANHPPPTGLSGSPSSPGPSCWWPAPRGLPAELIVHRPGRARHEAATFTPRLAGVCVGVGAGHSRGDRDCRV
jgi:hypothetical protein